MKRSVRKSFLLNWCWQKSQNYSAIIQWAFFILFIFEIWFLTWNFISVHFRLLKNGYFSMHFSHSIFPGSAPLLIIFLNSSNTALLSSCSHVLFTQDFLFPNLIFPSLRSCEHPAFIPAIWSNDSSCISGSSLSPSSTSICGKSRMNIYFLRALFIDQTLFWK